MKELIKKIFLKVKSCPNFIYYSVYFVEVLVYFRIVVSFCRSITAAKNGGLVKMFDEHSSLWFYKSADIFIVHETIFILFFALMLCLGCKIVVKKPKTALFLLLIPIILLLLEIIYMRCV